MTVSEFDVAYSPYSIIYCSLIHFKTPLRINVSGRQQLLPSDFLCEILWKVLQCLVSKIHDFMIQRTGATNLEFHQTILRTDCEINDSLGGAFQFFWSCSPKLGTMTRWWFQICFIFTPTWGNNLTLLIFFRWVEKNHQPML